MTTWEGIENKGLGDFGSAEPVPLGKPEPSGLGPSGECHTIAEHTPGPWRVGADLIRVHPNWRDEHGNAARESFHRNGFAKTIASVGKEDGDWRPIEQQVADARLIASAPDLLAQLEFAVRGLALIIEGSAQLDAMRAAIAKARGQ